MRSPEPSDRSHALALAAVFGLVSVPWTYGFEQTVGLPLWPAFIASATYFASPQGTLGLTRGFAGNILGAVYAIATLAAVQVLSLDVIGLALLVGVGMFIASLHALVPLVSFTPAGFFGYATAFSVHAAGVHLLLEGLAGELVATAVSMAIGAAIGWGSGRLADRLAR